jgi:hypothetical protein
MRKTNPIRAGSAGTGGTERAKRTQFCGVKCAKQSQLGGPTSGPEVDCAKRTQFARGRADAAGAASIVQNEPNFGPAGVRTSPIIPVFYHSSIPIRRLSCETKPICLGQAGKTIAKAGSLDDATRHQGTSAPNKANSQSWEGSPSHEDPKSRAGDSRDGRAFVQNKANSQDGTSDTNCCLRRSLW